jgi:hypothetical protein
MCLVNPQSEGCGRLPLVRINLRRKDSMSGPFDWHVGGQLILQIIQGELEKIKMICKILIKSYKDFMHFAEP